MLLAAGLAVPLALVGAQAAQAAWTLQNPQVPNKAIGTSLAGVSCTTGSSCTAVGSAEFPGSEFKTFAEGWNGSAWSLQSIPGAAISNLDAVSCPFAGNCIAVGDRSTGGTLVPLAAHSSGSQWTTQPPPAPSGAVSSYLSSVYCESGTSCTAVGSYNTSAGHQYTFAETLSGTTWKLRSTQQQAGATTSDLTSVTCTSTTSCLAVGYYLSPSYTLLAEHWNGTKWSIVSVPLPAGGSDGSLSGVACVSASKCYAVGSYETSGLVQALAEAWNGSAWSVQITPALGKANGLASVSCTSFGPCTAVGYHRTGGQSKTLAERWNGTKWSTQVSQNPLDSTTSSLAGVSCRSKVYCMAIGFYTDSSGTDFPLAEQNS